jgi:uncharacterized protein (DUF2062 family)
MIFLSVENAQSCLYYRLTLYFHSFLGHKLGKKNTLKKLKTEKKSFKSLLRKFMDLDDSPGKIALSFAIGVFIAFSPLLGTHLIMVFLIILIFRVSKVAILTGALINNPWTIVPMYTAGTFLGFIILRQPLAKFPNFSLSDFSSLPNFFDKFKIILYPYLIGCTVLGLFAALIAFFIVKLIFQKKQNPSSKKRESL